MSKRFPPIAKNFPHLLHGGDYYPEQWVDTPEVWDQDVELIKKANANTWIVGVFAWAMLEPREGHFDFGWMDKILGNMADNGIRLILATPGGARPAWLAQKYPEVCRVRADRRRELWGFRHNHCMTSPVYREKIVGLVERIASRYKGHPTLTLWHINNEYSGECHCDLCQNAFRNWLKKRYNNDLDAVNRAYWSRFWSHTYGDWSEIESPSPLGEQQVHALNIDWKRYTSDQTIDCFKAEAAPCRKHTPTVPITTNLMTLYSDLDYAKIARECDVVSWDTYPEYHNRVTDQKIACLTSFVHSQRRAMLQKPFILMECAPGQQNYKPVCKQKRPGVHELEAMQTIGHGSDSVIYFQWRKSRGSVEKFHGAVVDHYATPDNRIFREVAQLGADMQKLDGVVGADTPVEVAVIYDYENRWAVDDAKGPRNVDGGFYGTKDYPHTCIDHFRAFWHNGVSCDVIDDQMEFSKYKLVIAPMLYMIKPGVAEKITKFVENGGTFVTTYFSGVVNETDLVFNTGFPGPLRKVMGIWSEETDALYDDEHVLVKPEAGSGLSREYKGGFLCDIVHPEGAKVLANYASEFYANTPAVTRNDFGKGHAYYLACRFGDDFFDDFYGKLIDDLKLHRNLGVTLPAGVTAQRRVNGDEQFIFVLSFVKDACTIELKDSYIDALTGENVAGTLKLPGYGYRVLKSKS